MATMGMPYAFQNMLKEGYKHLSGVDEAVLKNLEACKQLSAMTKTSLGPNGAAGDVVHAAHTRWISGMNKMVINYLEKLFVTSDASVIVNELEVQHPAAKLLVMAANSQQQEIGDGANFVRCRCAYVRYPRIRRHQVITVGGEMLGNAETLLRDGLVPSEIADGYAKASAKVVLNGVTLYHRQFHTHRHLRSSNHWSSLALKTSTSATNKRYDSHAALKQWPASRIPVYTRALLGGWLHQGVDQQQAAWVGGPPGWPHRRGLHPSVPKKPGAWTFYIIRWLHYRTSCLTTTSQANFNVDNVRTVKITGSGLGASSVVNGMVLKRDAEGTIKQAQDAKIAVFAQGVDTEATEGKVGGVGVLLVHGVMRALISSNMRPQFQ